MQIASRPRVFISYARKDGESFARELRTEFETAGIPVWQDRTRMEGGVDWWNQISDAIQSAQFMVLVATPGALESEIVRREWKHARRHGVWVYPVIVPGAALDFHSMPRWMNSLHFFDYALTEQHELLIQFIQQVEHRPPRVPFMIEEKPEGFVERPQELEAILSQLLDKKRENPVAITAALKGAGGYGKTTLARAICRQEAVQNAFDDGILWVTLGENPGDLIPKLADLIELLTNKRSGFATIDIAKEALKEVLENQDVLLVVDDVWKPEHLVPFMDLGRHCALLVTTRFEFTVPANAHRISVDAMGQEQALQLLCTGIASPPDRTRLENLVKRLGNWPLLLKLANGVLRRRVQNQSTDDALTYVEKALNKLGLDAFDERNSDDRNLAVAKTLQVTFDLLRDGEYKRFRELAIFPGDADVPLSEVNRLWQATGAFDDVETEQLCELLHNLSLLLKFDPGKRVIRLHEVIRTYLIRLEPPLTPSEQNQLVTLNSQFLDAHHVDNWVRLPVEEEYLWQYLPYHLTQANRSKELRSLLTDLDWLQTKLNCTTPNSLLLDFKYLDDDNDLGLIQSALRLSAHILAEDTTLLRPQLYARLISHKNENEVVTSLLEQIEREIKQPTLLPILPSMDQAGDALVRVIAGHTGFVETLTIDPTCKWILSTVGFDVRSMQREGDVGRINRMMVNAAADSTSLIKQKSELGVVRIWNMETGLEARKFKIHQRSIFKLMVLPNGRQAVSTSADCTVKIWDLETGIVHGTFSEHAAEVHALAVSSDGNIIATGDAYGDIYLWDSATGALERKLDGHIDDVTALSILPGRFLVSASRDKTLRIWDMENGKCVRILIGHANFISDVVVTPDGKLVISASWDNTLKIWDATTGQCLRTLIGHKRQVTSLAVTPDGQRVLSGSWDNTVRVWRISDGLELSTFPEHNYVTDVDISSDGCYAVSGSYANTIRIWDIGRNTQVRTRHAHDNRISAITVSRDKHLVASASWDKTLKLWNSRDFSEVRTLDGHANWVLSAAFTADGTHVVSGSSDETVKVWSVETGQVVRSIGGHNDYVNAVAVSPDGSAIISGSRYALLRVWSFADGRLLRTIGQHHRGIRAVTITENGKLIALVSGMEFPGVNRLGSIGRASLRQEMLRSVATETRLEMYDYDSGEKLSTISSGDVIFCFANTPDGSRLVTASWYEKIRIWDPHDGQPLKTLTGHKWIIESVDITSDGRYAASVAQDRTLRIWDAQNGECISTFDLDEMLTACAWLHDGQTIIVGGESGRLHVLRLVFPQT